MEKDERIRKQKELIEYIGRYSEKDGLQPYASRILGLLMVTDKEEYTFDEIVSEMQISKGCVSMALQNLELRGLVEYVTYPGDRKRYYRVISRDVSSIIEEAENRIIQHVEMIERIISLKTDQHSSNVKMLKSIAEGLKFFIEKAENFRKDL